MDFKEDIKVNDDKEPKGHNGPVDGGSIDLDTFLEEMRNRRKHNEEEQEKQGDEEER